ncbi:MAG: hypothetical protein JXR76_30410 [Deltaproteobacteria bacterium]|nr:hypothetical protein [Deltaproteobacteria bacterium]
MKMILIILLCSLPLTIGLIGCDDDNKNDADKDGDSGATTDSATDTDSNVGTDSNSENDSNTNVDTDTPSETELANSCPDITDESQPGVAKLLEYSVFSFVEMGVWDNYYYFRKDNKLQRINLDDLTTEEIEETIGHVSELIGDTFFWTEKDETDTYIIKSAPVSDATNVTIVASGTRLPRFIGTHDGYLYLLFKDDFEIARAPLTGGDIVTFLPEVDPLGIIVHDGYIWWQDFTRESLNRTSLSGDTGERESLTGIFYGGALAGEGDTMYWTDYSLGTIEKWDADNGRVQLTGASADLLVVMDGTLYWPNGFGNASINSMKTDGSELKKLFCGFHSVDNLWTTGRYLVASTSEGVFKIDI